MDTITKKWCRSKIDEVAVKAGCYFDLEAAERVRDFFLKFLKHSKGKWAGKPFELLDWQWNDVVAPLFGWRRMSGKRRYRKAYIEVAKKNGKSTLCAGLGLYLLIGDGEDGAEVYSAAADRDQATIVFSEASRMVKASNDLSQHVMVTPYTKTLGFPRTNSIYKALSADVPTKEGLNIHGLIFDELHAQRTRDLWDTLTYGGAAREQPLLIAITTAGWNRESICYEQHRYAEQIMDGTFDDWSFFPYIACAEEDDDWTDPKVWAKANPSLGVTIDPEEFSEACKEAQASPTKENTFKRYRLNIWTQQDVRWLQMAKWDACDSDLGDLKGKSCFAGLDLSSTTDITALVLMFPVGQKYHVLPFFWIPAEGAHERERRDKVPYVTWANQGLIEMTPGGVVDQDRIRKKINELGKIYNIREIAIDRWNASQITTQLDGDGFEVVPFGQGYASMSSPTKELESLVIAGRIVHGGNPILRWMAGNVSVAIDDTENLKPSKKTSTERIDGIVAMIMALGRAQVDAGEVRSVYEDRGLVFV